MSRKPILVLSDLSSRSDAAVHFAGSLAHLLTAELHVLHAMGLRQRPLRVVMPALTNLNAALQSLDGAMHAQVQRLTPNLSSATAPAVDLDDAVRAITRRAGQIHPMVVVTPPVWEWNSKTRGANSLSRGTLRQLSVPVMVMRQARPKAHNRVVVLSHADGLNSEVVEAAGRWAFWLERVYSYVDVPVSGPDFDVILIDGGMPANEIIARVTEGADLVAVQAETLGKSELANQMKVVMRALLANHTAPVLLLSPQSSHAHAYGNVQMPATVAQA